MSQLNERDIRLTVVGERLRCSAPDGVLTSELVAEISRRRNELISLIQSSSFRQSALVALQSEGAGRPFFAVPGHNGDVFCFARLAQYLGRERPFLALEPPGLRSGEEPLGSIEALAAHHVREVLAWSPTGPIFLGGFCLGGLIAFEMAQQLRNRHGREVAQLVLFETTCPTAYRAHHRLSIALRCKLRGARHRLRQLFRTPVDEWGPLLRPLPVVADDRVAATTARAARHYLLRKYDGRVCFIGGSRESIRLGLRRQRDWARFVDGPFELETGPGDCNGDVMLQDPHVQHFADSLRERLARAETGGAP